MSPDVTRAGASTRFDAIDYYVGAAFGRSIWASGSLPVAGPETEDFVRRWHSTETKYGEKRTEHSFGRIGRAAKRSESEVNAW